MCDGKQDDDGAQRFWGITHGDGRLDIAYLALVGSLAQGLFEESSSNSRDSLLSARPDCMLAITCQSYFSFH